ncbi:hypothetical protein SAMN05660493_01554 [Epilithonimonas bovis DSM 19482]|uniref:Uncharacterized protein n=1 Tax=Epilithonimonas bovis DSM 19482 TaxID=1121284 RepID=A0A1U7PVE4_9FLAO|nr:hypothetical protein [Epilithonimonas bovis]SIT96859.1 hypothetical protein SAMN05660493_01554 [Epilithonimonas bovis DSM 19482]
MIKFTLTLLAVYILYYGGNILYDLFIKKEKVIVADEGETFSLEDIAAKDSEPISNVGIEDVENINMPNQFQKNEWSNNNDEDSSHVQDIEELRKRFEAEQEIDDISSTKNKIETPPVAKKKSEWKEFLGKAETNVRLVANYEGHKVFHSLI